MRRQAAPEAAGPRARPLAWPSCWNVRDLGGLPAAGGTIRPGALVRADNLARLAPAGRAALIAHGIRTVIDLRAPSELVLDPPPFAGDPAGDTPAYRHRSLLDLDNTTGMAALDAADRAPARQLAAYIAFVDHFAPQVAAAVTAVGEAPPGGVVVHCHAGKDRTGVLVALLLDLCGVPPEIIAADYALSGPTLQAHDAAIRAEGPRDARHPERTNPEYETPAGAMLDLLAYLAHRYGGTAAYLEQAGVTPATIAAVRARLRA